MSKIATDFMDELDAMNIRGVRPAATLFLYAVAFLVIFFFIWAANAHLDEISRGTGAVAPSIDAQIVQSLEGGILQELLVSQGDRVQKGQVLMRLSDVAFSSDQKGTEAKMLALRIRKARLEAEANGTDLALPEELKKKSPDIASNEQKLFTSRQEEYRNAIAMIEKKVESAGAQMDEQRAQIAKDTENMALIQKELAITSKMVAQKAVPQIEEIRLKRELNNAQGSRRAAQERLSSLQSDRSGAEQQLKDQADKFRSQALGELNDTETELKGISENLKNLSDRVARTEIKSPVEGIVNNIGLTTIGGVVEPAMKLVEIVPVGDDLKITARLSPNDIAFVKIGQPAKIRFTAYDSARYGYLEGKLTRIGANSLTTPEGDYYFEIEARTDRNFLGTPDHPLPIRPGMVAEIDVITGQKSVLSYLIKPFLRLKDRALTER